MSKTILILALAVLIAPQLNAADAVFSSAAIGAGNNDANVGLLSTKTYFNAVNANGSALTINGVSFAASSGANPTGGGYTVSGAPNTFGPSGGTNNVTGQLGALVNDFVYGSNQNTEVFTLTGLTAGRTYVLTFYNRAWDVPARTQNITTTSGATTSFNEDFNTKGDLNLLRYTFTASGTSETLNFAPQVFNYTKHIYGFSTEQTFNNTWTSGADWTTASWSVGVPNAVGANADFTTQGTPTSINLDAAQTVGHIRFDGANAWTVSGGSALTLQADVGGVSVLGATSGTHTISTAMTLNSDVLKTGAGTVVLSGAITDNGKNVTLGAGTLEVANAAAQAMSGIFSGGGNLTKSGAGTLTLSAANTYTGATTINAGTLALSGGSAIVDTGAVTIADAVGATLQLNASERVGSLAGGGVTGGAVQLGGNTLTVGDATSTTFAGIISSSGGGISKVGAGTLTLSGANTYNGQTNITAGTLVAANNTALGVGGHNGGTMSFIQDGATLALQGGISLNEHFHVWGAGVGGLGALRSISGNNSLTNTNGGAAGYALRTNVTVAVDADTLSVSGFYNGDGGSYGITKIGAGTLTISNASTHTGSTTVNGGTLALGNVNAIQSSTLDTGTSGAQTVTFTVAGANTYNIGGLAGADDLAIGNNTISVGSNNASTSYTGILSGSGGITKAGAGTLTLSGANTYTGLTTISAGKILNGSGNTFTNKGGLSMSGTGIFDLGGFNAGFTTSASVAGNTITNSSAATGASNATAPGTPSGAGVYVDALTFSTAGQNINALVTDGTTRKTQVVINNSNSAANLAGITNSANTFTGGLVLANNGGGTRLRITSLIGSGTPFGTGPIIIGQANTDKVGILLDTVNNNTLANDIIVNTSLGTDAVAAIRVDTSGNILSGKITANLANANFTFGGGASDRSVSLTGQITGSFGLQNLIAVGTVTLNNAGTANNYAGDTTIGTAAINSILALGRADQIPNGSAAGNVSLNGTLSLGGFSETINGLSGGSTGIVDGVSGTPTLTVGDNNATGANNTFSGVIRNTAGTLALTKIGIGTLTLSGTNTHTGGTTVNGGTLAFGTLPGGGAGNIRGTLNINPNATVNAGASWNLGHASGVSVNTINIDHGSLLFSATAFNGGTAASTITLTGGTIAGNGGGNTFDWYYGNTTAPSLITVASPDRSTISANLNLRLNSAANNLTFNVGSGTTSDGIDLLVSGNITSTGGGDALGGITKTGAGRMVLTGTSNYTGTTLISGGTLMLGNGGTAGSLSPSSNIANNSTLNINQSDNLIQGTDFGGLITGSGNLVQSGAGITKLTAMNDFTGDTDVTFGTLEAGAADALKSTANVNVTAGTLLLSGSGNRVNDNATITLSGATLSTGGLSETMGVLSVGSGNSVIDLAAGTSSVTFADSHLSPWTGLLAVWNWSGNLSGGGTDQLNFMNASGLTPAQISSVTFVNPAGLPAGTYGSQLLGTGELVPVPESSALLAGCLLLGVAGFQSRRSGVQQRTRRIDSLQLRGR